MTPAMHAATFPPPSPASTTLHHGRGAIVLVKRGDTEKATQAARLAETAAANIPAPARPPFRPPSPSQAGALLAALVSSPPTCPEEVEALVALAREILSPDPSTMTAGQKAAATRRARLQAGSGPTPILSPSKRGDRPSRPVLAPRPPAPEAPALPVLKPGQLPPVGTPIRYFARHMDARPPVDLRGVVTSLEKEAEGWGPGVLVLYPTLRHRGRTGVTVFHSWPSPWATVGR